MLLGHWTEAVSRGRKPWKGKIDNRGSQVDLSLIKMGIVPWSFFSLGPWSGNYKKATKRSKLTVMMLEASVSIT